MTNTIYLSLLIYLFSIIHFKGNAQHMLQIKPLYDEKELKVAYENFADSLNVLAIEKGYPRAVENLLKDLQNALRRAGRVS